MAPPTTNDTSIPPGSLILVTGANGFLATHTIKLLLSRGFHVRGTVRSLTQSAWLTTSVFRAETASGAFHLMHMPTLSDPLLCAQAVKDVSAVLAIAHGGTAWDPDPAKSVSPVIADTLALLEAARAEPSVRSFVYTSSVAASFIVRPGVAREIGQGTWNEEAVEVAGRGPPFDQPMRGFVNYSAAKVLAERAVFGFGMGEEGGEGRMFRVNSVLPASILGEYLDRSHGGHAYSAVKIAWDGETAKMAGQPGTIHVDVRDAALLHVAAALDPELDGQRLLGWADRYHWNDMLAVLRRRFPEHAVVDDVPSLGQLEFTTDDSLQLALLKKWGGRDGWIRFEETVVENVESILKLF